MKPYQLLLLTVLPGSSLVAAELCSTIGISRTLPYYTSTSPDLYNAVACGEHCALDIECRSYAIGLGMCLHYASPSWSTFEESPSSPWTLFDRDCTRVEAHRGQLVDPDDRCLVGPNKTKSQFRLLGPDFVPLIMTPEKRLRSRRAPALGEEEQTQAFGLASHYEEAPRVFFREAASAPAGLYDLIFAGSEMQYVAKAADGEMVFTSASTGSTAKDVNGRTIVTSIFTVDCDGQIGVMHDGVHYNWKLGSDSRTTSFTAGARIPDSTLIAFDFDGLGISRNKHELRSLVERRGLGLRCPVGQKAIDKEGARPVRSNGCGANGSIKVVPQYKFKDCCNTHDVCYDLCAEPSCAGCNTAFNLCMEGVCQMEHGIKKKTCQGVTKLYYEAVDKFGCKGFDSATKERCLCV